MNKESSWACPEERQSQTDAVTKLAENKNMIASFSRALLQDLQVEQSEQEFNHNLKTVVEKIYQASIT
ncbi:hypothetical protein [Halanaerobium praevalens]|uniref:hypothetical protein n=1 Tax=Halanaerobium praevalens TaxID=2331 RepID=UPI0002F6E93E|nr:hypothetical protein [Halanaerobium praevalens]